MEITQKEILEALHSFPNKEILQDGRNFIVKSKLSDGQEVVIKSFRKPNFINRIVYCFFRKSKARRSYEYAQKLIALDIGTPKPLAYYEDFGNFGLEGSYYISEFIPYDLTYRELVQIPDYPDHENILRQFTQFSFHLHEKGVMFKDHSPGNTLIQKISEGKYQFYLVDLNRMEFHDSLNFDQRMHNLRRLTPKKDMVEIMADEYAILYKKPKEKVLDALWKETSDFQNQFRRKQKLKNRYKNLLKF